uniref:Uncharacterized protein n=1 Tax=Romanomermis culicivorax TaxID=13658 RepID=A0A915HEE2_ROMCU
MTGSGRLTMGSGRGLQRGWFPWGPKHSYTGRICDHEGTNKVGLNFVSFPCVGQEDKFIDIEVECSGFWIEIFFTDHGGFIESILCEENWRALCGIVDLERGKDCCDGWVSGLCANDFFMGSNGYGCDRRRCIVSSQWHVIKECGLTDGLFGHCKGDGVDIR